MEKMILKNGIELEVQACLIVAAMGYKIKNKTLGEMEELLTDENLKQVKIKNKDDVVVNTFNNLTLASMEKNYLTKEIIFALKEKEV